MNGRERDGVDALRRLIEEFEHRARQLESALSRSYDFHFPPILPVVITPQNPPHWPTIIC